MFLYASSFFRAIEPLGRGRQHFDDDGRMLPPVSRAVIRVAADEDIRIIEPDVAVVRDPDFHIPGEGLAGLFNEACDQPFATADDQIVLIAEARHRVDSAVDELVTTRAVVFLGQVVLRRDQLECAGSRIHVGLRAASFAKFQAKHIARKPHAFFPTALCGLRLPMRPLSVPAFSSMMALISVGIRLSIAALTARASSSGEVTRTPTPPNALAIIS